MKYGDTALGALKRAIDDATRADCTSVEPELLTPELEQMFRDTFGGRMNKKAIVWRIEKIDPKLGAMRATHSVDCGQVRYEPRIETAFKRLESQPKETIRADYSMSTDGLLREIMAKYASDEISMNTAEINLMLLDAKIKYERATSAGVQAQYGK